MYVRWTHIPPDLTTSESWEVLGHHSISGGFPSLFSSTVMWPGPSSSSPYPSPPLWCLYHCLSGGDRCVSFIIVLNVKREAISCICKGFSHSSHIGRRGWGTTPPLHTVTIRQTFTVRWRGGRKSWNCICCRSSSSICSRKDWGIISSQDLPGTKERKRDRCQKHISLPQKYMQFIFG